ncbi:hypothetical protein [Streptomyces sp. NBC_01373]|uniref:hypothetical protein n=1 Tax=Streptomyces sp. NBC_01373 TaxID=2903843 RepID=UPI002253F039|nr:hypothetical protein [Streptomyces sp. NBC_01373]MCX4703871.1 hypothetical protein [Streptomyces sp. NBC_01373]
MDALGRLFNAATSATTTATPFHLKDSGGATIILIGATSGAATIQEAQDSAGTGAQNLAVFTKYYRQNSGTWTKVTQAAGATVTAGTGGLLVAEVDAAQLSDGYTHITASHASGSFVILPRDLTTQRKPENLRSVTA